MNTPLHIRAGAITDESIDLLGSVSVAEFELLAEEELAVSGEKKKLPTFQMTAYTGAAMHPGGWYRQEPIVVDLAGMDIPSQKMPIDKDHYTLVGHSTEITKTPSETRLKVKGVLSGYDATADHEPAKAAREILALSSNGFPYQASIDAHVSRIEYIEAGQSVKVNNQLFSGPLYVGRASTLRRIAILANGADGKTETKIAAGSNRMNPEFLAWLKANEYTDAEAAALTGKKLATLQAAWEATKTPPPAPPQTPPATPPNHSPETKTFHQKMEAIEAENTRQQYILDKAALVAEQHVGNAQKTKEIRELADHAIEDKTIDVRAFDLALLRCDRAIAPIIWTQSEKPMNEEVIAAAICQSGRLSNIDKHFDERTLQAAHTSFRRGISLRDLLAIAASRNNNYRGSSRDDAALCRAAFDIQATGPSTIAVPGILSNVANKFLASGFLYTEQAWRQISRIKNANDFKQMSTYRLTGANKFKKVAPGGELKHGTLSELAYTNQVDTYGILLGMDRRDIRNDDLGAFTSVPQELGRGGGDSLNEVFWTEFLDDAAFFPIDKSNANYDDGSTDSVLSLAGLENADTIFSLQTKPDGTPLGAMPKILLVPRALFATAKNLMNGSITSASQSTATVTVKNVWEGMFDIVTSVYLQSSAITGYSATAWYLAADPMNIATIEVAFLDGIETPVVETSEFEFDRLGLSMRAYLDFGCSKQEYRGAVKLKGAA